MSTILEVFKKYYQGLFLFMLDLCQQYENVTDSTRMWNSNAAKGSSFLANCQDPKFVPGWTRFFTNNLKVMDAIIPDYCPSVITNETQFSDTSPCGALFRGWINGKNPNANEGLSIDFTLYKCLIKLGPLFLKT